MRTSGSTASRRVGAPLGRRVRPVYEGGHVGDRVAHPIAMPKTRQVDGLVQVPSAGRIDGAQCDVRRIELWPSCRFAARLRFRRDLVRKGRAHLELIAQARESRPQHVAVGRVEDTCGRGTRRSLRKHRYLPGDRVRRRRARGRQGTAARWCGQADDRHRGHPDARARPHRGPNARTLVVVGPRRDLQFGDRLCWTREVPAGGGVRWLWSPPEWPRWNGRPRWWWWLRPTSRSWVRRSNSCCMPRCRRQRWRVPS